MIKGTKHSEETRKKLIASHLTESYKQKMTGEKHPMYGVHRISPMKGKKHTDITKKKMSISHIGLTAWSKGKKFPERSGKNHHFFGKHITAEQRIALSEARKGKMIGVTHWNWKGGSSYIGQKFRKKIEYAQWRSDVFKRDNWTCQTCGKRGDKIEAHHIKSFTNYPELRLDINNGVTLCKECHLLTHRRKK